jgi:hypothetical protein
MLLSPFYRILLLEKNCVRIPVPYPTFGKQILQTLKIVQSLPFEIVVKKL